MPIPVKPFLRRPHRYDRVRLAANIIVYAQQGVKSRPDLGTDGREA
jgi:hypothetical protein